MCRYRRPCRCSLLDPRLVGLCVGLSSTLWKNGRPDPNAVWHRGSDGSRDEADSEVVEFGDRSTERGTFGANFGRAIVTNGDFTAYVCDSASTVGAAVWGGACGGPRHCCIGWGSTSCKGRGGFGVLFPIFTMGNAIESLTVKCFRSVCENLTTFPFGKCIVGKLDSWAFW